MLLLDTMNLSLCPFGFSYKLSHLLMCIGLLQVLDQVGKSFHGSKAANLHMYTIAYHTIPGMGQRVYHPTSGWGTQTAGHQHTKILMIQQNVLIHNRQFHKAMFRVEVGSIMNGNHGSSVFPRLHIYYIQIYVNISQFLSA